MIGNFGGAEIFSFHPTKFLNTFEGGAVVTNNVELSKKIRLMISDIFCVAIEDSSKVRNQLALHRIIPE